MRFVLDQIGQDVKISLIDFPKNVGKGGEAIKSESAGIEAFVRQPPAYPVWQIVLPLCLTQCKDVSFIIKKKRG